MKLFRDFSLVRVLTLVSWCILVLYVLIQTN